MSQSVDDITYVPDYEETDVTTKGTKWFENGERETQGYGRGFSGEIV